MQALGFNGDDLRENRAGRMSEGQKERIRRGWRRTLIAIVVVLVVVIILATALIFIGQQNDSPVLTMIGIFLTVINAVVMGFGIQNGLRVNRDLSSGNVEITRGLVTHTIRVFRRAPTFVLKIDDVTMVVPKPVFLAIEDGKRYALYRAPASRTLLSAEAID